MAFFTARGYAHWHSRLVHLQSKKQALPDELLDWTAEHFGKSAEVQRYLGLKNSLKPEAEAAVAVMDRLVNAGVIRKSLRVGKK